MDRGWARGVELLDWDRKSRHTPRRLRSSPAPTPAPCSPVAGAVAARGGTFLCREGARLPAYLPMGRQLWPWCQGVCLLTRLCPMSHWAFWPVSHAGRRRHSQGAECGVRNSGLRRCPPGSQFCPLRPVSGLLGFLSSKTAQPVGSQ